MISLSAAIIGRHTVHITHCTYSLLLAPVTPEDLIALYEDSCQKHGTEPLEQVIDQLKVSYSLPIRVVQARTAKH